MDERALFFELSSERLRTRAQWAAVILILSIAIPYEVVDGQPQWIFGILRELPPAAVIAALSPALAGLAILVLRRVCARATALAVGILGVLVSAAVMIKLGADAAAWDVLRLPTSFAERPTSAIVALSLAGAGANLTFKEHARKDARVLLVASLVVVSVYYAWPARGEAPLTTVLRALSQLGQLPSVRLQIGLVTVAFFALFPLLAVLFALVHLRVPARRDQSYAGLVATVGLPALLALLVYRAMLLAIASVEVLAVAGGAALLFALLSLVTASLEVVVDGRHDETWSLRPLARAGVGAAVAIVLQAILSLPPKKGVDWSLSPPTHAAERLFGEHVPAWVRARTPERTAAMLTAARDVDAGVATALESLAKEGALVDVAGRRWVRLVAEVNDASRRAHLPFYLDPTVHLLGTGDGVKRSFRLASFRVEAVHPVRVGRATFATLHVRALSGSPGHGALLGLSRDLDPFALVELHEIESAETAYRDAASAEEPSCGAAADDDGARAMRRCGDALRALVSEHLREQLVAMTERHELQHQIDGPHLSLSTHVLRRLAGYRDDAQRRTNRELSAYLAELTSSAPPKLGVVHLVPFALLARGGAEHHVAVIVLLTLSGRRVTVVADRADLAAAIDELLSLDDATLRARARAVWRDAFGRTLQDPTP